MPWWALIPMSTSWKMPCAGKVVNKAYTFSKNGKTYVWKVEGKTLKMHEVKTKKVSDRLVEITEGLTMKMYH